VGLSESIPLCQRGVLLTLKGRWKEGRTDDRERRRREGGKGRNGIGLSRMRKDTMCMKDSRCGVLVDGTDEGMW
jgi:hypothetical protein